MSNRRILKAYERYDGNGRVVSGSLVLRDRIPKNGRWKELVGYQCCNDIVPSTALRLTFGLGFPVVDPTDVSLWNTLLGSSFTACAVDGLTVSLFSGGGFYLLPYCLADTGLVSIIDELNCVYGGGTDCFSSNAPLTTVILPEAIAFSGSGTFVSAGFLVPNITFYLPSCTNLGDTVLNNNVFNGVTGKTITLTVFANLMTCNSGNPDGDIQYLQANNTVTVITV